MKPSLTTLARAQALAVLYAVSAAGASALAQELPPPGLYRIDSATRMDQQAGPHDATTTFHTNGESGDQRTRAVVAGVDDGGRLSKANAPMTQCIKAGAPALPPAFAAQTCKKQGVSRDAGSVVHVAECPSGKLTVRIRRLDAKTWEYITETDLSNGTTPNLDGTRAMLQMAAHGAATPADRARAAKALADMPRMEATLARDRAAAEAAMAQALAGARTPQEKALVRQAAARMHGRVPLQIRDRTTLTRIAERCQAP